ncbi:type II toxin-antitoxin system RelE/ParE family toxin [Sphingomonas sp.]|uniref:type II toxin-antitoxin system RelE/ParE family toxin n=1 Tax=Sphingomonas sp. TaxID=28214 RepID=UPI0035BBE1DF
MKQVRWSRAADRDLTNAAAELSKYHPSIGRDLVVRAIASGRFLLEVPGAGERLGAAGWRKWRIKRTRYLVIYRPIETGIEIGRLRHDRSNWRLVPD